MYAGKVGDITTRIKVGVSLRKKRIKKEPCGSFSINVVGCRAFQRIKRIAFRYLHDQIFYPGIVG